MRNPRFLLPVLVTALLAAAVPAAGALDAATCVGVPATIRGTDLADTLTGTDGPDVILAGDGDDVISGLGGRRPHLRRAGQRPGRRRRRGRPHHRRPRRRCPRRRAGADLLVDGAGTTACWAARGPTTSPPASGPTPWRGAWTTTPSAAGRATTALDGGAGSDDYAGGPGADRLLGVLMRDTVSDAGTLDALGDTRWYRSLTLEPLGGTHLVFPNTVSGYDQRHTRPIEVTYAPGGLVLVERLSPEEYLLGIAEMPYSWHPAALRAQAIAARTYLANVLANPPRGVMAEFGFDICGSALCQVYLGAGRVQVVDGGSRWGAAVAATAGKILLYDGTPALAAYHSTAGATTRSNQDVWGGAAVPYLQAVEVPPQDSPFAAWSYELRLDQLLQILEAAGITLPDGVTAVSTLVTEPGGGPYRVRFKTPTGTTEVTAGRIQSAMNTYGPSLYGWLLPAYRPDGKALPADGALPHLHHERP